VITRPLLAHSPRPERTCASPIDPAYRVRVERWKALERIATALASIDRCSEAHLRDQAAAAWLLWDLGPFEVTGRGIGTPRMMEIHSCIQAADWDGFSRRVGDVVRWFGDRERGEAA